MANIIKHQGIVENINGSHLQVRIIQTSACASCSIKGHCTSADTKEKLIDIIDEQASRYHCGDNVWVMGELRMGAQAVLYAFILPFLIVKSAFSPSAGKSFTAPVEALPCVAAK